jgi:phosphatidylglycerophosphate synthase
MNGKLNRLWATKTKDDEWWSSFVTSPLAIGANCLAVDVAWLTPNRITLVSFIVAIVAAVFIVVGGTVNFILAAILIHVSHVLDCMDGQMARYREASSATGSYFDKLTDQIQVTLWFGAVGYAAYQQSSEILPVFLAFIGVAFYGLRGYAKYVAIQTEMSLDPKYLAKMTQANSRPETAGIGFGVRANALWFLAEQRKIFDFDEGVFIFMLSLALVLNALTPMLWVFAASQLFYGLYRAVQHGRRISENHKSTIQK